MPKTPQFRRRLDATADAIRAASGEAQDGEPLAVKGIRQLSDALQRAQVATIALGDRIGRLLVEPDGPTARQVAAEIATWVPQFVEAINQGGAGLSDLGVGISDTIAFKGGPIADALQSMFEDDVFDEQALASFMAAGLKSKLPPIEASGG